MKRYLPASLAGVVGRLPPPWELKCFLRSARDPRALVLPSGAAGVLGDAIVTDNLHLMIILIKK